MSRSPMYDPGATEACVNWIVGLTEICNKLSGVLNMDTATFEDLTLPEFYVSETDRCRFYQAPLGNKLWMYTPAPVIKKNGVVITPENDGFEIDYLGGSIAFNDEYVLQPTDIVTASATYIVDNSQVLDTINAQINDLAQKAGDYKGSFDTLEDLQSAYDEAESGDYAIVENENTIYIYNGTEHAWVDVHKGVDLSDYMPTEQIEALLNEKENSISPKGNTASADMYYYGGRKTWVGLADKVLAVALSGLSTADSTPLEETDTLIEALGKLQAQINDYIHPLSGLNEPTISTAGRIGQDYTNLSNGDKYHLVSIETEDGYTDYNWAQYADKSYVDQAIRSSVLNAWHKDY